MFEHIQKNDVTIHFDAVDGKSFFFYRSQIAAIRKVPADLPSSPGAVEVIFTMISGVEITAYIVASGWGEIVQVMEHGGQPIKRGT